MSRHGELCELVHSTAEKFRKYQQDMDAFAVKFYNGFGEYIGNTRAIVCLPASPEDREPNRIQYLMAEALQSRDDSYMDFSIGILLPDCVATVPVHLKKPENSYVVRLPGLGKEYRVAPDEWSEVTPIYDDILAAVRAKYERSFERFLSHGEYWEGLDINLETPEA